MKYFEQLRGWPSKCLKVHRVRAIKTFFYLFYLKYACITMQYGESQKVSHVIGWARKSWSMFKGEGAWNILPSWNISTHLSLVVIVDNPLGDLACFVRPPNDFWISKRFCKVSLCVNILLILNGIKVTQKCYCMSGTLLLPSGVRHWYINKIYILISS